MPAKVKADDIAVDDAPTTIDPYATLELSKDATAEQIKSAYRKAALKHHPDKAADADKAAAHTRFQEVAFAYAILSDERRRRRYDTTGRTEESLDLDDDDFDWASFFREQYADIVTTESIEAFGRTYKGGDEERADLLAAYTLYKGRMTRVYETVMLSDVLEDDERFREIIDAAIARDEVESFDRYANETEKSKKARITAARKQRERESKEVEETKAEIEGRRKDKPGKKGAGKGGDDIGDLAALIQQRQQGRAANFFDNLEAKYASKGSKRSAEDEPSEETFAKNRAKGKKSKQ